MLTRIKAWGNSQGLRFTKYILKEVGLDVGDQVEITVERGRIIIKPANKIRGKYSLKKLVAKMPKGHRPEEEGWGEPTGKEIW